MEAEQDEQTKLNEMASQLAGNSREENDELKTQVLNMVYPVGSIYIGTTNVNPSTFIGGTWEAYAEGRTLIGAGTGTDENNEEKTFTANNTGGEYNHQLSIAEMPSHTHELNMGWGAGSTDGTKGRADGHSPANRWSMNSAGGDQAHNNVQPYIVTYMWKRIN